VTDPVRLRDLVGDLRHFASIRRVTFQDGPERGLEALLIAAGPLALTVLAGRAMDIGSLTWGGIPVGWTGPAGFVAPAHVNPDAEGGRGFERALSGFLMTGGLTHIRQPAGTEPLHGRLPFLPARILACGEDWDAGLIYCEGEMRQARHGHEALVLRRRIEVPIAGTGLRLCDRVTNEAADPVSPELLYHINLGYPVACPGTSVLLDGHEVVAPIAMPEPGPPAPSVCMAVVSDRPECRVLPGPAANVALALRFSADTLPCLQFWRDLRPRNGIFSVEPCTSAPGGAAPPLAPGSSRTYRLSLDLTDRPARLS
jgi:hypothetical protein